MTALLIIGGIIIAIIIFTVGCLVGYDIGVKDVRGFRP